MSNMWLYTPDGFFSPRYDEFCGENDVMIRSRCEGDLKKLASILGEENYEITELPESDYRYRMKINKWDWADYVSECALDERTTKETGGIKNINDSGNRFEMYLAIWYVMRLFQDYEVASKNDDDKKMLEIEEILYSGVLATMFEYEDKNIEQAKLDAALGGFDVSFFDNVAV